MWGCEVYTILYLVVVGTHRVLIFTSGIPMALARALPLTAKSALTLARIRGLISPFVGFGLDVHMLAL